MSYGKLRYICSDSHTKPRPNNIDHLNALQHMYPEALMVELLSI